MRPQELNHSRYEITIAGVLDPVWIRWLNADTILDEQQKDGNYVTKITCTVKDQADLHGLIKKLWNLNLTLIALSCL